MRRRPCSHSTARTSAVARSRSTKRRTNLAAVAVVVAAAATVVVKTSSAIARVGDVPTRVLATQPKMKFTTVGPEGARNILREKQRRNRMAAKELRVQFPQLASIRIDFAFSDESLQPPAPQSIVLHPPARAYFGYPCPYARA